MWTQDNGGAWTADVQYRLPGEHSSHLGKFPALDVREDHTDRSNGRR